LQKYLGAYSLQNKTSIILLKGMSPDFSTGHEVIEPFKGMSPDFSTGHEVMNPLKTEGILRTFQKVILIAHPKWKDFKNNGTKRKLVSIPFK
jgi:hypothetical protein